MEYTSFNSDHKKYERMRNVFTLCNTAIVLMFFMMMLVHINALGVCSLTEEYLCWVVSSWELPLLGWVDSLPVVLPLEWQLCDPRENQWKIQAPVSVLQIG